MKGQGKTYPSLAQTETAPCLDLRGDAVLLGALGYLFSWLASLS